MHNCSRRASKDHKEHQDPAEQDRKWMSVEVHLGFQRFGSSSFPSEKQTQNAWRMHGVVILKIPWTDLQIASSVVVLPLWD